MPGKHTLSCENTAPQQPIPHHASYGRRAFTPKPNGNVFTALPIRKDSHGTAVTLVCYRKDRWIELVNLGGFFASRAGQSSLPGGSAGAPLPQIKKALFERLTSLLIPSI